MYKVEIIADSVNPYGSRLTTMRVTFPRFILAEFNTHRAFSRNSASSRAIPFKKMVEAVKQNPFIPIKWMLDHPGMQGSQYIEDQKDVNLCKAEWLRARDAAVDHASALNGGILEYIGNVYRNGTQIKESTKVSKQICNRLLEPFMWHTVLVTATDWENFFAQRAHPAAEIHMQKLAEMMLEAYNASKPKLLQRGEWHIPFEDKINKYDLLGYLLEHPTGEDSNELTLKISTMMCARTSYTLPGDELSEWTVEKYVKKHDELAAANHWSPFEHCAQSKLNTYSGNFCGWLQYRKTFDNENQRDPRVIKEMVL